MALPSDPSLADVLNRDCHCITVERDDLTSRLRHDLADAKLGDAIEEVQKTLFAASPVFVSSLHVATMQRSIDAIESIVANPGYLEAILDRAPPIARVDPRTRGVFYGYDFHLSEDGPRLIEVNTNAGGGLLSLYLARAQRACCEPVAELTTGTLDLDGLERQMVQMFRREAAASGRTLETIAIVDEHPEQQFLGPEMELFRRLFEQAGVRAIVADPSELVATAHGLSTSRGGPGPIDLIYNRLTDFYLEEPPHTPLRRAYENGDVLLTPAPRHHAVYADKRNLALLTDRERLSSWGVDAATLEVLDRVVPETRLVVPDDAETLWSERKSLFFKPVTGYGSRGTYDGAKLTRKTFQSILESDYVAQRRVPPSTRTLQLEDGPKELKVDLRCFVYDGQIQLLGARMYRGQTTNLRTQGGGLATVFTDAPLSSTPPAR